MNCIAEFIGLIIITLRRNYFLSLKRARKKSVTDKSIFWLTNASIGKFNKFNDPY